LFVSRFLVGQRKVRKFVGKPKPPILVDRADGLGRLVAAFLGLSAVSLCFFRHNGETAS
jgi:hypothetical protein